MEGSKAANASAKTNKAGRNLPLAIAVGALLFVIIISTLLWFPPGFIAFWVIALTVGAWEVYHALSLANIKAEKIPLLVTVPVLIIASYFFATYFQPADGLAALVGCLVLGTLFSLALRIRGGLDNFVQDASATMFVLGYIGLLGGTASLVLAQPDGGLRLLMLFLCVPANDTGAYAVGSLLGRHKMVPTISPGKTWEGLVGGLIVSATVGALAAKYMIHINIWSGLIIGIALAIAGTIGDLIESMIKRNAGLKDTSRVLPGHGGAMDRLDSLLVGAPVLWLLLYILAP